MAGGEPDIPLEGDVEPEDDEHVVAGRYRIVRPIARGGMAAVYLAEQIQLRRQVALKILFPQRDPEESANFEQRFRLEAETLATLDHPNIVTLYDYGQADDGRFFLAMEFIDGPRFTDVVADKRLDPDRAIELILQVCAALRYAHRRGVVHRDLKPSNLLLRRDAEGVERLKVVDFGLAKVAEVDQSLTREGLVLGSPHCMAPEQIKGLPVDHRADIYAIGILLFRALTGEYPFHSGTATGTMVAHLQEPIPAFSAVAPDVQLPAKLEAVVRKCLAKKADDRYADVRALMTALGDCVGMRVESDSQYSQPTITAPVSPTLLPEGATPTEPAATRQSLGVGIAAALGLAGFAALLLIGAVSWWFLHGEKSVATSGGATVAGDARGAGAPGGTASQGAEAGPTAVVGSATTGASAGGAATASRTGSAGDAAGDATGDAATAPGTSTAVGTTGTTPAPHDATGTTGATSAPHDATAAAHPATKAAGTHRQPPRAPAKPGDAPPKDKATTPEGYMPLPEDFK